MKRLSFNDEMMRAWLEGRKTVTRRLMKPQPKDHHHWDTLPGYEFEHKMMDCIDGLHCKFWHYIPGRDIDGEQWIRSPYSPGETVFIAETWACVADGPLAVVPMIAYRDGKTKRVETFPDGTTVYNFTKPDIWKWQSPVTMPEWASRSKAIIKSIRPERVQEIPWQEAIQEGIEVQYCCNGQDCACQGLPVYNPTDDFQILWDSLYPGSWERNDWVWRFELERVG
jgi:hypothetical protein